MVATSDVDQTGVLVTYNDANGKSITRSTMMDFNGDGYPDIFQRGVIQYTNTQGGISGEKYTGIGDIVSENKSEGWALGSDPIISISSTISHIAKGKDHTNNQGSANKAKARMSGSVSLPPSNKDWSTESFMDVNGDGLPDKIVKGNKVRLNLGYSFTEPIDWNIDRIQGGKGITYNGNIGGGFNKGSSSFAGGYNVVTSKNGEEYSMMDVNSDGLPDKVWKDGNNIMVSLNIGDGFDTAISWKGASHLNESASTSEGAEIAFTANFTPKFAPIKISINPVASVSHSINRTNYTLQDVDGDGYLDIVESDKESELKVTLPSAERICSRA